MVRNRIIALALMGALALGGVGWKAALASEAAFGQDVHSGPISTWSAYQPADALEAPAQVNHLPAYNAYAQVYASAVPAAPTAGVTQNPALGIALPQGAGAGELPAGLRDYVRQ